VIKEMDRMYMLSLAAQSFEGIDNITDVNTAIPELVISNFNNFTKYYQVRVIGHFYSINKVCNYRIEWLWKSHNIVNTFFITEESCENKLLKEGIVFYKKINKL
jgi:hypothetical protein